MAKNGLRHARRGQLAAWNIWVNCNPSWKCDVFRLQSVNDHIRL